MSALVVGSPLSSLSLPALVLMVMVPIGLLWAPQPIRRDRRTIAALVGFTLVMVGGPVYAVICNICLICERCAWWWCPWECLFL